MKKYLKVVAFLAGGLGLVIFLIYRERVQNKTTGRCLPAVGFERGRENCLAAVTVIVPDHSGSGVIISKGGFVLTKAHVIENNLTGLIIVRRETLSGPESAHFAKLASIDYERDLALLWVPTHFPVIARLGGSTNLRPGSPVYTVSTPAGLETNIFSAGYFRARTRDLTDLQDDLLLDLATIPGSSGGGIYDRNGDLIGLDDALLKSGDGTVWPNFSYGTSVEQVRIFLKASFDCLDPASPCVPPLINPPPASAVEAPSAPSCR